MPTTSINRCLSLAELQSAAQGNLDAARFEHLRDCPLCAAAFEGLSLADEDELELLLNTPSAEDQHQQEAKILPLSPKPFVLGKTRAPGRNLLWSGLAIAATLLIGGFLLTQNQGLSTGIDNSSLPKDVFSSIQEPFARRQRSESTVGPVDPYQKAAIAYEEGDYSAAVSAYRDELARFKEPFHDTRGYYELGITHWRLNQLDSATDYLTRARMGEADYFEDASWALALAYLQQRDSASAKTVLQDLQKLENTSYRDEVKDLLGKL